MGSFTGVHRFNSCGRAKHIKASPRANCREENSGRDHGASYATKDESSKRILHQVSIMFRHFLYAPFTLVSETICVQIVEGETGF